MVEAVALGAGGHFRPADLLDKMRPFIMAFIARYLPFEMSRMVEADQFGIIPLLEISMAGLTGGHIHLAPDFDFLAFSFFDGPQTVPTKPSFSLHAFFFMAVFAALAGMANKTFLRGITGLFNVTGTGKSGRVMVIRGQLEVRRMAQFTFERGRLSLVAVLLAVTVGTEVHGGLDGFTRLMRKDRVADRASDIAFEVDRVIEIYQLGILPFLEIAMARLALGHSDRSVRVDDQVPFLFDRGGIGRPERRDNEDRGREYQD